MKMRRTEKTSQSSWLVKGACVVALLAGGVCCLTGCQTSIGGQTLPSAYYLEDDIQYFPAGPEFLLTNEVRAIEQYKAERAELEQGNTTPVSPATPTP